MSTYEGRLNSFKNKLNAHLSKLTGIEKDYSLDLKHQDYLNLKYVLSDINNLLTYRLSLEAIKWIKSYFKLNDEWYRNILNQVDSTKPNTNGFDIVIAEPKILVEVKCINPINAGSVYGAAQRNGILDDAIRLRDGVRGLPNTSEYYKFLIIEDIPERTKNALVEMLKISTPRSKTELRRKRHYVKRDMILIEKEITIKKLKLDFIYVKAISVQDIAAI